MFVAVGAADGAGVPSETGTVLGLATATPAICVGPAEVVRTDAEEPHAATAIKAANRRAAEGITRREARRRG